MTTMAKVCGSCRREHAGEKKTCDPCRERARRRQLEYRAANPDKSRAAQRAWHERNREDANAGRRARYERNRDGELAAKRAYHAENRERISEQKRAYRRVNAEAIAEQKRAWALKNPETRAAAHRRRRARKRNAPAEPYTVADVLARWGVECVVCGLPIDLDAPRNEPGGLQLDHVVPLARGGADTVENVMPIHAGPCNQHKGARLLSELPASGWSLVITDPGTVVASITPEQSAAPMTLTAFA